MWMYFELCHSRSLLLTSIFSEYDTTYPTILTRFLHVRYRSVKAIRYRSVKMFDRFSISLIFFYRKLFSARFQSFGRLDFNFSPDGLLFLFSRLLLLHALTHFERFFYVHQIYYWNFPNRAFFGQKSIFRPNFKENFVFSFLKYKFNIIYFCWNISKWNKKTRKKNDQWFVEVLLIFSLLSKDQS